MTKNCRLAGLFVAVSATLLGITPVSAAVTVTVSPTTTQQTIRGFGAATAYYQTWLTAHTNRKAIYDTIFTGLGLSYLRIGNWNQDTTASLSDDSSIVAEGKSRLGARLRILVSSWSAPGFLKPSDSVNGGSRPKSQNTLKKESGKYVYAKFAHWWKSSLLKMQKKGIYPDDMSLQNEPDMNATYAETYFSPSQSDSIAGYDSALIYVSDSVKTLATHPQIIGPEVLGIGYGEFQNYAKKLDTASLTAYAYHLYHGNANDSKYNDPDGFNTIFHTLSSTYSNKPTVMTEFCPMRDSAYPSDLLTLARVMQNALVQGNVSGYIDWELIWDTHGQMIAIENPWSPSSWTTTSGYKVNPEYHAMRHFSKFVAPGWKRVTATSSDSSTVRTVAFLSTGGDSLTVVAINISAASQTLNLSTGTFSGSGEVWQSQVNGKMSQKLPSDGTGSIPLPDSSITTVVLAKATNTGIASTSAHIQDLSIMQHSSHAVTFRMEASDREGTLELLSPDGRLLSRAAVPAGVTEAALSLEHPIHGLAVAVLAHGTSIQRTTVVLP